MLPKIIVKIYDCCRTTSEKFNTYFNFNVLSKAFFVSVAENVHAVRPTE